MLTDKIKASRIERLRWKKQKQFYDEYIKSDSWRRRADHALERAGFKCQLCCSDEFLVVHHRTYERLGNESPEDLTVLCKECHDGFHLRKREQRKRNENMLKEIGNELGEWGIIHPLDNKEPHIIYVSKSVRVDRYKTHKKPTKD